MTANYALPDYLGGAAPSVIAREMQQLVVALDQQIPPKRQARRNVLIATWNIRHFGALTEKWNSEDGDSPRRDWRGLHAITEIVSRFDVIAIQEIKHDLTCLRRLAATLGPAWSYIVTDINEGTKGNAERMGFLFDTGRVQLAGLAGELSLPEKGDAFFKRLDTSDLFAQFARTPYAVSFRAGSQNFILVTAHVIYGKDAADRTDEIRAMSRWLADWAAEEARDDGSLLLLGDFNIDRAGDPNFQAFMSGGLVIPPELTNQPRTLSDLARDKPGTANFYDQIAWFETARRRKLSLDYVTANSFNFAPHIHQSEPALGYGALSYRMSDHLPLWVEFRVPRAED